MDAPETLQNAFVYFSDPDRCFQYALKLRWPNGIVSCPRCGSEEHSFIKTRRIWFCKGCKKQFTLKVGTIFEDSPLGLDKWMCAFWMMCNCRNGVSSCEISRALGITQKSAWFMLHRIRKAMQDEPGKLSGTNEMDETFLGGKIKTMHKSKKSQKAVKASEKHGIIGKTIVVGMLERYGRVRAEVVVDGTREVLHGLAAKHIADGSTLVTDEWHPYKGTNLTHEIINPAEAYANGLIHTNGIENFWSLLMRGLGGIYLSRAVSSLPLHRRTGIPV
jgi:transposase-like protein